MRPEVWLSQILDTWTPGLLQDLLWLTETNPYTLLMSCLLASIGFVLVSKLIPRLSPYFVAKGRAGRDLLKPNQPVL